MKTKEKIYNKNWFMWFMLLFLAPVGIFLMWKNKKFNSVVRMILSVSFGFIFFIAIIVGSTDDTSENKNNLKKEVVDTSEKNKIPVTESEENIKEETKATNKDTIEYNGISYKIIEVEGGNLSGERLPNVAVDIGYGDRTYWAFTNQYGQLINVVADKVIVQDDSTEPVNADGRYYDDEAKVSGTEQPDLDEGHVIADSLGGVSNAYNITPQNRILNRKGDQAYMEKVIRDAGGCENFVATITYPNTTTQIPSGYKYEYVLNGNSIVDEFDNVNPDTVISNIKSQESNSNESKDTNANEKEGLSAIDTNGNGKVTIAEAKAAGYTMPILSDHWLYKYMDDRDGDGVVGE
ncbi:DNA/RNA non-specific endonuclease [Anaerosacchariphilus polymeriproducens]|nr:DNA/RNA non-specific endonuclease [Anaerosacchariphilus polymeriproducens]